MSLLKKYYTRGKKALSMTAALSSGFYDAYRLDAFSSPDRKKLVSAVQKFCYNICQSFGIKVVEVEPIPSTHGLWVSNHISWLDIAVVGSVAPVFFLSKDEIGQWPIFGKLAKAGGTLFIKRGSGDAGSITTQIANFLRQGHSVVFFPEATTTDGKQVKKIYGKLLQAAMDTNLPICPMLIAYVEDGKLSENAAYYGGRTMKDSLLCVMDSKNITAYVLPLPAIYPEGKSCSALTKELYAAMQDGLQKLHNTVLDDTHNSTIDDRHSKA